jgi:SPOR domain
MAVRERRGGLQSWVPGLFAGFWVLLAVFSAAYLFRVITTPQADRAESAVASPAAAPAEPAAAGGPSALSEQQAAALMQASEAKDKEISALKTSVQDLSGQLAELSTRLKPLEKVLGPVAELTTSTAVTTSPPAPGAMRAPDPPKAPPPAAGAEPAPPPPTPKPVEAAEQPKPAAEPERAAAPEEPDHAVAEAEPPSPAPVATDEPDDAPAAASTETAALNPAPSIPPGTTRFGIEIGAVDKQDGIRAMWRDLLTNHAALVAGLEARRVIAPDKKWRLIAGPFASAAEAMQACGLFKKASMPCEATVFAGDSF